MTQHQICPARSLHVSKNSKNKLPLHLCNTRDETAEGREISKALLRPDGSETAPGNCHYQQ
jgi:hypothetical protein